MTILITGSAGLIGSALSKFLSARGKTVIGVDIRAPLAQHRFDVSSLPSMPDMLENVSGIVHLAAVSRVIDGERDPEKCWRVNVDTTRKLLTAAARAKRRPWFIYASSREVYGPQERQPVNENATFQPVNVYARSKIAAELLVGEAREAGLATSVLRFANVYGSVHDHADRVVPAFIAAGVAGGVLRVDGKDCSFDINHVDDVVRGIAAVTDTLDAGETRLPALHFVSGQATTLFELANLCCHVGARGARIVEAPSRNFDVHRFVGDPERARSILGWQSRIDLATGLTRLAQEFAGSRQ